MDATMVNKINKHSKVVGALALLLTLSACGQGFKARESQLLQTASLKTQNFYSSVKEDQLRQPASSPAAKPSSTPQAANDNEPLQWRFVTLYPEVETKVLANFKHIDPNHEINTKLLKDALIFFYVNRKNFSNSKVITVIDYSRSSDQKRLYVIEMNSGRVWSTYVAHGRGSDKNHDGLPEVFNNKLNSNATSIGAFLTLGSYQGENGYSLRLKGLSKYNSNAFERNVVIHGADYVRDASVKQGRSWGCPAVARKYTAKLINTIKGGSLVYSGASKPSIHRQL